MASYSDSSPEQTKIVLRRRILSLKGFVIGIIAGLLAVGFRLSLEYVEHLRNNLIAFSLSHKSFYMALPAALFCLFIVIVVVVTSKFAPEAGGSGIPHLKGYLAGFESFRAWRM